MERGRWSLVAARLPAISGIAIARGTVIPAFFALSYAADLETGLKRLAQFKSLPGPTRMRVFSGGCPACVEYDSVDPRAPMPPSLGSLQLVCELEKIQGATAHLVRPISAGLTVRKRADDRSLAIWGCCLNGQTRSTWPLRHKIQSDALSLKLQAFGRTSRRTPSFNLGRETIACR
jgi:hypothetical protein